MTEPTDALVPPGAGWLEPDLLAEFEAVYRAEVGRVMAFFARRSRELQTVADLTLEIFVKAMTSYASFDSARGTARGWLLGIARRMYARHCEHTPHADGTRPGRPLAGLRATGRLSEPPPLDARRIRAS